jgi:hypothetical protein
MMFKRHFGATPVQWRIQTRKNKPERSDYARALGQKLKPQNQASSFGLMQRLSGRG